MATQGGGRGESQGKRNVRVAKCQRPKRCSALEPVLEHCELASMDNSSPGSEAAQSVSQQKGIPKRILAKLRDGYVKLMNEMASGADLTGVSSFYGASSGPGHDYRSASTLVLNLSRRSPTSVA